MRYLGKIIIFLLVFLFWANTVLAGFGISPPSVSNDHLSPGAHFEQQISFSRADPRGDLNIGLVIDAPEIKDWLSIDKGLSFIFPDGQQEVRMKVLVDVPKNAEFKNYRGYIRATATPIGGAGGGGGVAIVVGATIQVVLDVTREKVSGFLVRIFDIPQLELGKNVKVSMMIENTGNVGISPSRVHLDIYDQYQRLLYSGDDTSFNLIEPFQTKAIFAEFPAKLEIGYYWGEIKIFKDDEIKDSGKKYFGVVEKESLFAKIAELKVKKEIVIGIGIIIFLLVLSLLVFLKIKKRKEKFKI